MDAVWSEALAMEERTHERQYTRFHEVAGALRMARRLTWLHGRGALDRHQQGARMTNPLVQKGELFTGNATYIAGEWVRARDYESLQGLVRAQAEEIARLRGDHTPPPDSAPAEPR